MSKKPTNSAQVQRRRTKGTRMIGVELDVQLTEQVSQYAKTNGRTRRWIYESALRKFIGAK